MLNIARPTGGRQGETRISFQAHYLLSNTALTSSLESPFKHPSQLHWGSLTSHQGVTPFCLSQGSLIPAGTRGAFPFLIPTITDPTFPKGEVVYHYYNWPVWDSKGISGRKETGKNLECLQGGKEIHCFTFFMQLTPQPSQLERVLAAHFPFFISVPRKITKFVSLHICPLCPQTGRRWPNLRSLGFFADESHSRWGMLIHWLI